MFVKRLNPKKKRSFDKGTLKNDFGAPQPAKAAGLNLPVFFYPLEKLLRILYFSVVNAGFLAFLHRAFAGNTAFTRCKLVLVVKLFPIMQIIFLVFQIVYSQLVPPQQFVGRGFQIITNPIDSFYVGLIQPLEPITYRRLRSVQQLCDFALIQIVVYQ